MQDGQLSYVCNVVSSVTHARWSGRLCVKCGQLSHVCKMISSFTRAMWPAQSRIQGGHLAHLYESRATSARWASRSCDI
ncbi:hypothetical protein GBA52_020148 [Prunus armeniaca]|nr:hypothetical protein GBA52_020148 [Prunus armeniaca]